MHGVELQVRQCRRAVGAHQRARGQPRRATRRHAPASATLRREEVRAEEAGDLRVGRAVLRRRL